MPPSTKLVIAPAEVIHPLSASEKDQRKDFEKKIRDGIKSVQGGFRDIADACYHIKKLELYRTEGTFEEYFRKTFGFSRAHSYRLVMAGEILSKLVSPAGDIERQLVTESHFRPLSALRHDPAGPENVIRLLHAWKSMKGARDEITPAMVEAATIVINPPEAPPESQITSNRTAQRVLDLIEAARKQLPQGSSKEVRDIFKKLQKDASETVVPRTTGIGWTRETWNPLEGCSRATHSPGCINCYAAKQMATRWAHKYPGLARKLGDGSYAFTGKIVLEMHRLSEPLKMKTGTKFFVNSMSDLFHDSVPSEFIDQVFDVMEKASWHTFQVLTKRPENMAAYTRKRYSSDDDAPANIWLGTSTENEDTYKERIDVLRTVRARVRWISAEPLLGPLELGDTKGLDWVVVGGESEGDTKMEKKWVEDLQKQCSKAGIAFFFKQWGDYGEDGNKAKKEKLTAEQKAAGILRNKSAVLNGKIYEEFPTPR